MMSNDKTQAMEGYVCMANCTNKETNRTSAHVIRGIEAYTAMNSVSINSGAHAARCKSRTQYITQQSTCASNVMTLTYVSLSTRWDPPVFVMSSAMESRYQSLLFLNPGVHDAAADASSSRHTLTMNRTLSLRG